MFLLFVIKQKTNQGTELNMENPKQNSSKSFLM